MKGATHWLSKIGGILAFTAKAVRIVYNVVEKRKLYVKILIIQGDIEGACEKKDVLIIKQAKRRKGSY